MTSRNNKVNINWTIKDQWEKAMANYVQLCKEDEETCKSLLVEMGREDGGDGDRLEPRDEPEDLAEITCWNCGEVTVMDPELGYADFTCPHCGEWMHFDYEEHYHLDPDDNYDLWESETFDLGDEIEADNGRYPQFGVVLGVITDYAGRPVCIKVWRDEDPNDWRVGCFDYIQADQVGLHEKWGCAETALLRIGYELVKLNDDVWFWRNEETGDEIVW